VCGFRDLQSVCFATCIIITISTFLLDLKQKAFCHSFVVWREPVK
jgi:hypothetical protein